MQRHTRTTAGTFALLVFLDVAAASSETPVQPAGYLHDRQELAALLDAGDKARAYELVRSLNARHPHDAELWWRQGHLAMDLGHWTEAVTALERSWALGTLFDAWTAQRLAEAHARLEQREAAYAWLRRALDARLDRRFELVENPAFAAYADDPAFRELAGLAPGPLDDRDARWAWDIDWLVAEAQRMHASPARPAWSASFAAAAESLKARVPELSDAEVTVGIQRLVALLGDGHSYVWFGFVHERALAPAELPPDALPIVLHPFEGQLYVVNGQDDGAALISGRVVAFGSLSAAAFIEAAAPYVHGDNAESWKFLGAHFGFRSLALHAAVGSADGDAVPVTVEFDDGRRLTRRLSAGRYEFPRKLRPMPGQQRVPEFLQHVDTVYRDRSLPEHDAHYLQVNNIVNADGPETLAAFAARAVETALEDGRRNLVVDFRLNNGGNNFLCRGLLRELLRFELADAANRLFVITRHETFSAAQNCSNRIEAITNAVFVGEPSSSRPNFTGEESQVLLPYSGTIVSISNLYWQDSHPWDRRPWIGIDLPAPLTFAAYRDGRDPALEAIAAVITKE